MRACAAEGMGTRAYNTVKRNGGKVRSSGRPVGVGCFSFTSVEKEIFVKLVGCATTRSVLSVT
jgi:hypothetical protein